MFRDAEFFNTEITENTERKAVRQSNGSFLCDLRVLCGDVFVLRNSVASVLTTGTSP
jgi:hypothetical protein